MKRRLSNANFPRTPEGGVYHVGVKAGEVANRIITVGDPMRARVLAERLDGSEPPFVLESHRGFLTITGTYRGVPVSIVAIGMGFPMMDIFLRETRAVVDGEMIVVRFGSCGAFSGIPAASMVVPTGAFAVTRNFDHFVPDEKLAAESAYNLSSVLEADHELRELLQTELEKTLKPSEIFTGLNASCDSFYSSQGRDDPNFCDDNEGLIAHIKSRYPNAQTFEMETFMLLHLARLSSKYKTEGRTDPNARTPSIRAAAIQMVFAQRNNNDFITPNQVKHLEDTAGLAALEATVKIRLNSI